MSENKNDSTVDLDHSDSTPDEPSKNAEVDLRADDRAVSWSRALVFAVLACAAVVLGYLTYYYVQSEQVDDFENEVGCG